jgi:DNA-damage-inducible protein J
MAMTSINVRVDETDKRQFDAFCDALGLSMSTAIVLFMKATLRQQKIPFTLEVDPFYGEANMRQLEKGMQAFAQGQRGRAFTMEELEARLHATEN